MRKIINIAVLVSGGGTNLQALIDAQNAGILTFGKIRLVVSSKEGAYALTRAKENKIPTAVISKATYKTSQAVESALIDALEEKKIDLIVLAGYLSILSADFTRRYDHRIINVHPSLIPSFCGEGFYGLRVHQAALDKGVKVSGATVHFVNEIPDGGEIILQKAVSIHEGDTPEILQKRVMRQAEWKILPKAVEIVSKAMIEKENKV